MTTTSHLTSTEDPFGLLDDALRHEPIKGELLTMSPTGYKTAQWLSSGVRGVVKTKTQTAEVHRMNRTRVLTLPDVLLVDEVVPGIEIAVAAFGVVNQWTLNSGTGPLSEFRC